MTDYRSTLSPTHPLVKRYTGVNGKANLGKAIARFLGYEGRNGGWIYTRNGTPVCQGYAAFADMKGARFHQPDGPGTYGWELADGSIASLFTLARRLDERDTKAAS